MNELYDNNLNRFLASGRGDPGEFTGTDLEGNPLLPSPGETIDSPWGQSVVDRVTPRYSSEAVRDASILTPNEGQLCYILEISEFQIFDGTQWVPAGTGAFLPLSGGTLTGDLILDDGETSTVVRVRREIGGVAGEAQLAIASDGGASTVVRNSRDGVNGYYFLLRDDSFEVKNGANDRVLLAEDGGILRLGGERLYLYSNDGLALEASTTRTYLYGTPNDPTGAAANMFVNSTNFPGRVSISTAVTAFVDEGEVGPLTTRMGAGESPRGFDIGAVLGTIFDRFDAIEARLDAIENP